MEVSAALPPQRHGRFPTSHQTIPRSRFRHKGLRTREATPLDSHPTAPSFHSHTDSPPSPHPIPHIGEWLGLGKDLPNPITSGPPGHSSRDYAPPPKLISQLNSRPRVAEPGPFEDDFVDFAKAKQQDLTHLEAQLPVQFQHIRVPQELQDSHLFNSRAKDPLAHISPPPMAPPPPRP